LQEEGRELIYKGALNKRGGVQGDSGDLQLYLFDHALLMVKQKSKHEQFKVYRRVGLQLVYHLSAIGSCWRVQPIPLELLLISANDDANNTARPQGNRNNKALTKRNSFTKSTPYVPNFPIKVEGKGFAITFVHLGRKYYQMTLWASTYVSQRKWVENITKQQDAMRERSTIFETVTLSEGFFVGPNKVNCAAPYSMSG
jgi:RHO1 GDP-GTP exchange protein 1/2